MQKEFPEVEVHFWQSIDLKEKAVFYEHVSNLLDGGVTLMEALESFCAKVKNPLFYNEVASLLRLIDSGDSMSTAMKKHPRSFDKSEISIVEAGEQSGTMQKSFASLAEDVRSRDDLRRKLISATTYPLIILGFLVMAILVVMVFVIPKLLPLFETSGTELPLSTRSLIATSQFISGHFILIIIFLGLLGAGIYSYARSPTGKAFFDQLALKMPLVGTVYRNYLIVRISTTFWLLLGAGIPIIKTLKLTGESTNNTVYENLMAGVVSQVERGNKIAESFVFVDERGEFFPSDFTQLLAAAEKTSTINKVCAKMAAQYNREVDNSVTTLVKYVEPAAILISGGFVIWFAFAIFSAVLKITETVG